jgi:hypothetical protein
MMKKPALFLWLLLAGVSLNAQLQRAVHENARQSVIALSDDLTVLPRALMGTVTQNFESYPDFTLDLNPWSTIDSDGFPTYGITGYSFPHSGEAMSFIVFNPGSSTPSLLDDPAILPHGGMRYAACFSSQTHANNDWLISPLIELGTNGRLKFWVKSYTSNYGLERYKVGVSVTNNQPASFTIISGESYLEAPAAAWQQKEFDLSSYAGQDVFVGIQCVSDNAFILMVDDIEITSGPAGIQVASWENDVSVYPNPAKDHLQIRTGFPIKSIRLVDLSGRQKIRMEDCGMNCTLDLKDMADGIYILQIISEQGSIAGKINILK